MGNVAVTYDEMRHAANQLKNGRNEIEEKLNSMKKLVNDLVNQGFVTDRASKKFDADFNEFHTGAQKTIEGLDGMGQYLESAADAFQQTDESLAK